MNNIYIYLIIIIILYVIVISSKPRTKRKKSSSAKIKGELGEDKISNILKTLPTKHYRLINNVLLKREEGNVNSSQIDHIVVSCYGIFIIETKNFNGLITGNDNSKEWTQHLNKKFQFYSPTRQNYGHIKALEESLKLPEDIFIPIVVFLSNATLKVTSKYHVINDMDLKKTILAYRTQRLDKDDVNAIEKQIKSLNIYSSKTMKKHVKDINKKYNN